MQLKVSTDYAIRIVYYLALKGGAAVCAGGKHSERQDGKYIDG